MPSVGASTSRDNKDYSWVDGADAAEAEGLGLGTALVTACRRLNNRILHALRTKPRARMGLHMMGIGLGLWMLDTQMRSHGVVYPVTRLSWEL